MSNCTSLRVLAVAVVAGTACNKNDNYVDGMTELRAATRGSLCIWNHRQPKDFAQLRVALRDPDVRTHLIVCTNDPEEAEALGTDPIVIPPFSSRESDLARIVEEYLVEAARRLGLSPTSSPTSIASG